MKRFFNPYLDENIHMLRGLSTLDVGFFRPHHIAHLPQLARKCKSLKRTIVFPRCGERNECNDSFCYDYLVDCAIATLKAEIGDHFSLNDFPELPYQYARFLDKDTIEECDINLNLFTKGAKWLKDLGTVDASSHHLYTFKLLKKYAASAGSYEFLLLQVTK
jgi:hypothetical protein